MLEAGDANFAPITLKFGVYTTHTKCFRFPIWDMWYSNYFTMRIEDFTMIRLELVKNKTTVFYKSLFFSTKKWKLCNGVVSTWKSKVSAFQNNQKFWRGHSLKGVEILWRRRYVWEYGGRSIKNTSIHFIFFLGSNHTTPGDLEKQGYKCWKCRETPQREGLHFEFVKTLDSLYC